jgi:hypothetical protein
MSMEGDSINLVDMSKKVFVKIKLSENRKYWERWTSTNKLDWELSDRIETLEEVLKSQQELIDNNYKNLFDVIVKK